VTRRLVTPIFNLRSIALYLFLAWLGSRLLIAQVPTGTILGLVKDSSGAAVPEAVVTVRNDDTAVTRQANTSDDGTYQIPALPVGHYSVKFEKSGFTEQTQTGFVLDVDQRIVVNASLQVGASTQQVVVTGEAPIVNTSTSSLGGVVDEKQISELPLNGRSYVDLALLQPGVSNNTNYSNGNAQGGTQGVWFSSNGSTLRSNNFTIDGAPMINLRGTTAGAIGLTMGVDGIQEYKVITDAFSADYGLMMGSQVVIASKGGTNQFHGDVFEYLRNSVLDARNFFDASPGGRRLPEFQRNNFGAAFGGPIRKDKTFFFGVYEGLRQNFGVTTVDNVIGAGCHGAAGAVITNAACPQLGTSVPSVTIAPVVAPLLNLYPSPNLPSNRYTFPFTSPTRVDYGQMRVDQAFSASDSLFARYTVQDSYNAATNPYPEFATLTEGRDQFITLSETHIISPALLNTGRLSFSRTNIGVANQYFQDLIGPQYSFIAGQPIGGINIGGITNLGPTGTAPQQLVQNLFTLSDDVYYTKGRHALKFGAVANRFENSMIETTARQGTLTFASIATFLRGIPSSYTALTPGSNLDRKFIYYVPGMYAQDDWRVNARFTLNLGLRYEFMTTPREARGREWAFRNVTDATTTQGPVIRNPSLKNFSPRAGFAWDVFGNGKTSVRSAFGEYYDLGNIGFVLYNYPQGTPPLSSQSTVQVPSTSTTPVSLPLVFGNPGNALHTMDYNAHQPRMLQWNFSIEQQLLANMALAVSYVGSRGIHLWMGEEGNPCIPTSIVNGVPNWLTNGAPGASCPNGRLNPNWGTDQLHDTNGDSTYHSMQVVLRNRLSRGLHFQSAFTWSKLIDTTQGQGFQGECVSSGAGVGVYPADRRDYVRGPACFDATLNFRMSVLYTLPNVSSGNQFTKTLLNGWWTGGLISAQSGFPFTPIVNTYRSLSDHSSSANQSDYASYGTASVAPGQIGPDGSVNTTNVTFVPFNKDTVITHNPNQWFNPLMFVPGRLGYLGTVSRDVLRGPSLADVDFSVNKDTPLRLLGEHGNLQFRAEAFNLLNHANFGMPSGNVFAGTLTDKTNYVEAPLATAGSITKTVATSRQIQLALKIVF